ncbi:MAG: polyprenyl synthetase family protein [Gammaproteobacteria bacterium]|nr:polyprenyl synthetase family protein [Gammaproteobacteria bacterium]
MTEPALLGEVRERMEHLLDALLPPEQPSPIDLHAAMRHGVLGGGKRLRPFLVHACGRLLNSPLPALDLAAAAVEFTHAYSLIHDDLPAMDDDDLRRGQPTVHRKYGEACAILAGDALQTLAFETLAMRPAASLTAAKRIEMLGILAEASGYRGMAGGQALDLALVGDTPAADLLESMHRAKTGALLRACARMAIACAPHPEPRARDRLDRYAAAVGLAFQIQDDILDVVGDSAKTGKESGADAAREKPNFVSVIGLDGARQRLTTLLEESLEALAPFDTGADPLRWLAEYTVSRER